MYIYIYIQTSRAVLSKVQELTVSGSGFRVKDFGFKVWGFGVAMWGSRFRV